MVVYLSVCLPHVPISGVHPDGGDYHAAKAVLDATSLSHDLTTGLQKGIYWKPTFPDLPVMIFFMMSKFSLPSLFQKR